MTNAPEQGTSFEAGTATFDHGIGANGVPRADTLADNSRYFNAVCSTGMGYFNPKVADQFFSEYPHNAESVKMSDGTRYFATFFRSANPQIWPISAYKLISESICKFFRQGIPKR
jgi:hypothetical protein